MGDSVEEYIDMITLARDRGEGEKYATAVVGPPVEVEFDDGQELLDAAYKDLRSRNIDPVSCSQAELADALERCSQ